MPPGSQLHRSTTVKSSKHCTAPLSSTTGAILPLVARTTLEATAKTHELTIDFTSYFARICSGGEQIYAAPLIINLTSPGRGVLLCANPAGCSTNTTK